MYDRTKINLFFFLLCTCQTIHSANVNIVDEQTVASVGRHIITLSDFKLRYNNFLNSTGTKDSKIVREAILNNMINEILLYSYDSNDNIFSDLDYIRELEWNKKKVVLAYLKEQEIYSKITVTDQEMREAFLRVNETISARHLYAQTEEEANELYELVKNGVSFEQLATQVFTDSVLKNNGGFVGYFTWGDMDPAFEETAYSLNVNEISKPVKTAQGYSIIKLESKVQKPLLTEYEFQNKKAHLEKVLRIKKKIPAEQEYINTVFNRSELAFNENILHDILSGTFNNENTDSDNPDKYQQECVSYKERKYSRQEIEDKIFTLPDEHVKRISSIEVLKAAVEGLLINEILYAMAVDKGYSSVEPVNEMTEGYNKRIFLKHKINYITQNSSVSDSALIKYYKDNIHSFSKERELNLQEILVDNQQLADSLISLIKNGQDFGKLANEFSLRKWSAVNNGVMGFGPISRFGSYKELFWKSEIGELIGPLQIENMFGIFRVLGKTDSKPMDFEIVRSEVLKAARSENQTIAVKEYIEKMKKKISVSINSDLLGSYNILG